jgi:VCBS repeat-containing protein
VVATVRAQGYSAIQTLSVQVRGISLNPQSSILNPDEWQTVALDGMGRLHLTPTRPGLLDIRVTAIDQDGFSNSYIHSVRVKDPADTQAPQLAWGGALQGATALGTPVTIGTLTQVQAALQEQQLMGYKLEIAPAGTAAWSTLAEQISPAENIAAALALPSIDPALLHNGVYNLRLSAWDLVGRTTELNARIVIDSAQKTIAVQSATDQIYTLAGHQLALTRMLETGPQSTINNQQSSDFGNWTIPALDTKLTNDQAAFTAMGSTAPWQEGARVWLQIPANLADANAPIQNLSFTLGTTKETLGSAVGAPVVFHPVFGTSQGWTLTAHSSEATSTDSLQRQGISLYDNNTGMPWVPQWYTLTAADGTAYQLDAAGKVTSVTFADGVQWLVTDAGIAAVTGSSGERVDFLRDDSGNIVRVVGTQASRLQAGGTPAIPEQIATAYKYDAQGRLILARTIGIADLGTPYGYQANGLAYTDTITANFGAAVSWTSSATANQWQGTLVAGQTTTLAFSVRDSEIASTVHTPGAQGAVIVAIESSSTAVLEIVGGTVIGTQSTINNQLSSALTTTLVRITEAGLKLLRLSGSGTAQIKVSLAGDMNRDGLVNGADSAAWEQAALDPQSSILNPDLNGDGAVNTTDRQVLYANYGLRANQAPVQLPSTAGGGGAGGEGLKTHTDLAANVGLNTVAQDMEGDSVFWRVLGATHGTAKLSSDGLNILFTPEAGYAGLATITVQADDGFASSAPIELSVNVSGAKLLALHLAPLSMLRAGESAVLHATADFEDEKNVAIIDGGYLTVRQATLPSPASGRGAGGEGAVAIDDTRDLLIARAQGPALVIVTRTDATGHTVQAVNSLNAELPADPNADYAADPMQVQPDVYPGTLTLTPGGTRQLKVHLLDPNTGAQTNISTAAQTSAITVLDAQGQPVLDATTGQPLTTPAVTSATRYYSSDESIATVDANGLITAHQSGKVTISVVHLETPVVTDYLIGTDPVTGQPTYTPIYKMGTESVIGQSDIALNVQAAQLTDTDPTTVTPQAITVSAQDGAAVSADTGETVLIGAGALKQDTSVSISRIDINNLQVVTGLAAPLPGVLTAMAAFHLDLGADQTNVPVQLAIPVQGNPAFNAGDEVLFLRRGQVPDANGVMQDTWWVMDNGFVDANGVARTASPPYAGITGSGDILIVNAATPNAQTGEVELTGSMSNLYAVGIGGVGGIALALRSGGSLGGLSAAMSVIGLMASAAAPIFSLHRTLDGAFQKSDVPVSVDTNGKITLNVQQPNGLGTAAVYGTPTVAGMEFVDGKLEVSLENLYQKDAQGQPLANQQNAKIRVWISPDELLVDGQGNATSELWSGAACVQNGILMWEMLADVTVTGDTMVAKLDIPPGIALGQHKITVQRMVQITEDLANGTTAWSASGDQVTLSMRGREGITAVSTGRQVDIFKDGALIKELKYADFAAQMPGLSANNFIGGYKTDQMAFSEDNRLLFIAGMNGHIAIVDTATLRVVDYWKLPGTGDNISSLAVCGQYLYVAEGGRYVAGNGQHRLLRVNIDPASPDFMNNETGVQQIDLSGINAPYGYFDLAVVKGRHNYLAVTASLDNLPLQGGTRASGNAFVLDLNLLIDTTPGTPLVVQPGGVRVVDFEANKGKGPQYISPASVETDDDGNPVELRFLLSNALDYNSGVGAIRIALNRDGSFSGDASSKSVTMSLASLGYSSVFGNRYQMNVQRAQGAVYYHDPATQTEYALVADYFMEFNDSLWKENPASFATKQAGGKLGIIKDPFGAAEYLGSTTPIVGASLKDLDISPDGSTLLGNLVYWENLPSGILKWNLAELIKAANEHSLAQQNSSRPIPLDREGGIFSNTQIPEATPAKYDLGYVFDMVSNTTPTVVQAGNARYGDIARVDILKALQAQYPGVSVSGFNEANISIEAGGATLVTYKDANDKPHLVSGVNDTQLDAVSAASAASYEGQFSQTGVFFLSPKFSKTELDALRKGEHLESRTVEIRISGLTVGNKIDQTCLLKIDLNDFTETQGRVFFGDRPLDNPGYTRFELSDEVKVRDDGAPLTAAQALDVWRVEQRLAYLGFCAFNSPEGYNLTDPLPGYFTPPSNNPRVPKEFKVDGTFGKEEETALRAFQAIKDHNADNYTAGILNETAHPKVSVSSSSRPESNLAWLNAYNAPHWMNIYASFDLNASLGSASGNFKDGTTKYFEIYGTSWMRDMLKAWSVLREQQASAGLVSADQITINGLADSTYRTLNGAGNPLHIAGGHSIGMSMDLGINEFIDKDSIQKRNNAISNPDISANLPADTPIQWSVANAVKWSGYLPGNLDPLGGADNGQQQALRNFLALYAVTVNDGISGNGTWDDLVQFVKNGVQQGLFGYGASSMISNTYIGGKTPSDVSNPNPYDGMNLVLKKLDIQSSAKTVHYNHFHIDIAAPSIIPLPNNLLAESAQAAGYAVIAQSIAAEAQTNFGFEQGELTMLFMDMPNTPPQYTPVIVAQAAQTTSQGADRTIGICHTIENRPESKLSAVNATSIVMAAMAYLEDFEHIKFDQSSYLAAYNNAKMTLLQAPKHGELMLWAGRQTGRYLSTDYTYEGLDSATVLVDVSGYKVKVIYRFVLMKNVPGSSDQGEATDDRNICPNGAVWKISTTPDANGNSTVNSVEHLTSDTNTLIADLAASASSLGSTVLGNLAGETAGVTVNLADLQGAAIGQTVGSTITLDTSASGYGWFIDSTPADNSEFLPTSNPNEWVAKAGSAAAGKMDMLSVLLHEYGHALGINHSADPNDYMGTTLTAGVRRLPSAEEMALMQQLVAQAKSTLTPTPLPLAGEGQNAPAFPTLPLGTSFIGFLGLLRSSRYGGVSIAPDASTLVTQYDWAANATLTNGSLNAADGWSTQGSVNIGPSTGSGQAGGATLYEVSGTQTRLSQVFLLNPTDRFLSFTLSGTALDDLTGAPDDAFEVALLDANTGASLLGGTGLTRTDSFLNLQADGTQRFADCVTCINNADGSRTYRVDLAGVPAGVAANLSFDLIGFGGNGSHVTVSDVRLSGLPQLHDDTATMLEDGTLAFNPFAQVDNAAILQLGSHVVDQPAHGAVTVNADGTFSYTPAADYFGADTFTYRLSDGPLESNLATVSLTITPVNDAPVVADVQATTAEDTALVIALGAYATDIDLPSTAGGRGGWTASIVSGPAHGVLVANADGTFSYTPDANYNGADSFTYLVNDGALDSNIATVTLAITAVNDAPTLGDLNLAAVEDTALAMNLLAQATDIEGDPLTAAIVAGPLHGQVTFNADGSFTYTPDLNYNGADSFTYKVNDGQLDSNIATVTLTIAAVNDAPVAADAAMTTLEDTALVIDLYAYATDVDNTLPSTAGGRGAGGEGSFTATIVTGPAHGVLTQNADGSYTYTPDANYNGADIFAYRVNDGQLDSNVATVTLTIAAVNDAPVAADAAMTTLEDTALVIDLRTYATDVDSSTFTARIVAGPAHGVLTQNADGSYTYTPDANYNGADSFTYLVNDGALDSNIATVTLAITAVNDAPTLGDLNLAAVEDTALAMNLLAAASDIDGDTLTASIVAGAQHGQVSINADGSFTYTPDLNFNGVDSFTYKVNDGQLDSNIATVMLAVAAVNDAPVAADTVVTTAEDTALVIDLIAYATDVETPSPQPSPAGGRGGFSARIVTGPAHGVLTQNADSTFSYLADANYNGADSFTYLVNDGALDSNIATVTLAITAVNDAPTLGDLNFAAVEDTALAMNLLAQATDIEGDPLTAVVVAGPLHGQISVNADGSFTYTPELNYNGADSFTYKVNDGALDSNIATVMLSIAAVNDAPVVADAAMATLEDTALVIDLRTYATDVDSSTFTARIVTGPAHGALAQNADGTFSYIADANYNGADSFTYLVNDGQLDSNVATVTLAIASVNDAPQGANATVTTLEDTPYIFQVADFGFTDAMDAGSNAGANNFANVIVNSLPQAGTLTNNGVAVMAGQSISVADIAAGLLRFTPAANANSAAYATFTFQVQDDGGVANGGINTDPIAKTLTLDVTSVNDAPLGTSTTVTTLEDMPYVFQAADFGFSDAIDAGSTAGANHFANVIIGALPMAGSLMLNGVAVTSGQSIAVADIAAGLLQLAPAANANGAGYANFTFQVQDDGGVANGGINTDQTARTMTIDVTAVNDAPVAVDMQAAGLEDVPLNLNLLATASDVDGDVLTPVIVAGPLHGQLLRNADGTFDYLSDLNYFGTDSFTYKVNDGQLDSNIVTVSLTVAAVNDAPVALSAMVAGLEDTPYIFTWSDFRVSDVDSTGLGITINTLPADGVMQLFDGLSWNNVTAGQRVSKTDIDACLLCFNPDANESGFEGYSATGIGNNLQNYASFTYQADDGFLSSAVASMIVNITPVVDAPSLSLTALAGASGATATRFSTSWESAPNRSHTFTILPRDTLEGWNVVKEAKRDDDHHHGHHDDDKGQGAFILWSSGDKMLHAKQDHDRHADGKDRDHDDHKPYTIVQAAAGNGNNWLELGDAMGMGHQTYGIERAVETRAGISYRLSLDYAGRLGYDMAHTRIGIYVDGVQIGTHASTGGTTSQSTRLSNDDSQVAGYSPNTALNWETLTFNFTGNGAMQNIRIVMEGTASEKNGRGAMIDDIVLTEVMPINTGYQDSPIRLSGVLAALTDTDGSEALEVTVGAIPTGAVLSDGTNSFTATDSLHLVAVTGWNLANLSITAPIGFTGSFALTIAASATETATGETANYAVSLPVTVVAPIVEMPVAEHEHHGHHRERHHEHDEAADDKCGDDTNVLRQADGTTDMTTSHLTRLSNDDSQVIGYSHSTKLSENDSQVAGHQDERSNMLHSEHAQPKPILGFPISGLSANSGFREQNKGMQSKPITDWSAGSGSSILDDESRKGSKAKPTNNWLSDFLGVDKNEAKQDAASLTKLSVTLKKENNRQGS